MNASDLIGKIREFGNRETVIRASDELSPEGKRRQLALIKQERDDFRSVAVATMKRDFNDLLDRFNANDAARKAAQEKTAASWDYERLNYQAKAAAAKIATAPDLGEIRNLYEAAKNSGDKHGYRALIETAVEAIQNRWGIETEAAMLVRLMRRDLNGLLSTPELQAINDRGAELATEAIAIKSILAELHNFYGGAVSGVWGLTVDDELGWMRDSIQVEYISMPNGDFSQSVTITPWEERREKMRGF